MSFESTQDDDLYPELLAWNARVFAAGHYSVAYHLLAAALEAAELQPLTERFEQIQERAREQQAEIDQVEPAYQHSTESAQRRGHHGIFTMLAEQARGRGVILHGQSIIQRHKGKQW